MPSDLNKLAEDFIDGLHVDWFTGPAEYRADLEKILTRVRDEAIAEEREQCAKVADAENAALQRCAPASGDDSTCAACGRQQKPGDPPLTDGECVDCRH